MTDKSTTTTDQLRWLTQVRCRKAGAIGSFDEVWTTVVEAPNRDAANAAALAKCAESGREPSHVQGCWRDGRPLA